MDYGKFVEGKVRKTKIMIKKKRKKIKKSFKGLKGTGFGRKLL